MLRSQLITGAMVAVCQVMKRDAKTIKDAWVQGLIEHLGKKCAAVGLANKAE